MSYWVVEFDGEDPGPSDDFTFEFASIESIIRNSSDYKLSKNFINEISMLISSRENYSIIGNIKKITSPDGKVYTNKAIYALIGLIEIDGTKLQTGCLLAEYSDDTFGLLGLWPDGLVEAVKSDRSLLTNLLKLIVNAPAKWDGVYLILPIESSSGSSGSNKINRL